MSYRQALIVLASLSSCAYAQMADMNPAGMFLMDLSSGTSMNPPAWPMPMTMHPIASWNTMLMGQAFLVDTQQSGPRGGDKLYSTNWLMAAAEHKLGTRGAIQVDLMLSLEPATITDRRYPLLFQTGETAFGSPARGRPAPPQLHHGSRPQLRLYADPQHNA